MNKLVFIPGTVFFAAVLFHSGVLFADSVPAPAARAADRAAEEQAARDAAAGEPKEDKNFKTTVVGKPQRDTDLIGEYKQPVWTTKRRFTDTEVYVLPPGELSLDFWFITRGDMVSDGQPFNRWKLELEYGLGKRFLADFFLQFEQAGYSGELKLSEIELELRWAWADWGVLWGNPTIQVDYEFKTQAPQAMEAKLMFGDQFKDRWFWGLNFFYGREFGSPGEQEFGATLGMSYIFIYNRLSFGFELKTELEGAGEDGVVLAGPSLQIRATKNIYIDLIPMAGVRFGEGLPGGSDAVGAYQVYLILGSTFE